MSRILDAARKSFLDELDSHGDFWRVFRVGTLIDLLTSYLLLYQKNQDPIHLMNAFNAIMKLSCDKKLAKIRLGDSLQQSFREFNRQNDLVIQTYDECLLEAKNKLANCQRNVNGVADTISYLKVLNHLALDDFNNQIIDDLLCAIANEFDSLDT